MKFNLRAILAFYCKCVALAVAALKVELFVIYFELNDFTNDRILFLNSWFCLLCSGKVNKCDWQKSVESTVEQIEEPKILSDSVE